MSVIDAETVEEKWNDLTCDKCGIGITWSGRGGKPKYCEECRSTMSHKKKTVQSPRTTRPNAPVSAKASQDVLTRILIILTVMLAHARLSRLGVYNEQYEEHMGLTDEEAEALARPLARWSTTNKLGQRVLGPVVRNEDLLEACIALFEWNRRNTSLIRQIAGTRKAVNNVAPEAPTAGRAGNPTVPRPVNGYVGASLI